MYHKYNLYYNIITTKIMKDQLHSKYYICYKQKITRAKEAVGKVMPNDIKTEIAYKKYTSEPLYQLCATFPQLLAK